MPWAVAGAAVAAAGSLASGALNKPKTPSTSGASAAASEQDTKIYAADYNAAQNANTISMQSLQWAQQAYVNQAQQTQAYMASLAGAGGAALDQYRNSALPLYQSYAGQAASYGSEANQNLAASRAMADTSAANDAARSSALNSLTSYGIDPSQTRYQALDLGTRIQGAAAVAQAGENARLQTQQAGITMMGQAASTGLNIGAQGSSMLSSANQMGVNTTQLGSSMLGTGLDWAKQGVNAYNGATQAVAGSVGGDTSSFNQKQQQYTDNNAQATGLSSAIGGVLGSINNAGSGNNIGNALKSAYNYVSGSGSSSGGLNYTTPVEGGLY